ncbi:MAG: hypothetical protein IJT02_02800 [Synergistaceae bacterium]|nr:hypothetical protein [Synergistaceae bacterium]
MAGGFVVSRTVKAFLGDTVDQVHDVRVVVVIEVVVDGYELSDRFGLCTVSKLQSRASTDIQVGDYR